MNGDGYSDVIIGAPFYDDGANNNEGRAFLYHGSATGLSATPNNTPGDANQANASFGISVAGAGDVNGDGYGDVIIGSSIITEVFPVKEERLSIMVRQPVSLPHPTAPLMMPTRQVPYLAIRLPALVM
ncbi:MAG: FG-GAP repeat protein [Chitinophagaceae bacterium]|nr:FG-GAP repeat protein [Chitinophagaceae bacterium]